MGKIKKSKSFEDYIKLFIRALENPIIAFLFSVIILIFIGKFKPIWWRHILTLVLIFCFAEVLSRIILKGGGGIAQILPILFGHETRPKGHVYLVFFLAVLIIPIISDILTNYLINRVITIENIRILIISSFIVALLIFVALKSAFYKRKE